jgi:hypothetical protein
LRPSTGAVFLFDSWAGAGADVTATPTTAIADGAAVETRADGNCTTLVVVRADGSRQEVER